MKTAAKIFLILGMIYQAILIYPIVVGILALKKLNSANNVKELQTMAILSLLFVNMVAGILMFCMKDDDLLGDRPKENVEFKQTAQNNYDYQNVNGGNDSAAKVEAEAAEPFGDVYSDENQGDTEVKE